MYTCVSDCVNQCVLCCWSVCAYEKVNRLACDGICVCLCVFVFCVYFCSESCVSEFLFAWLFFPKYESGCNCINKKDCHLQFFYLRAKWQFTDWAVQARMLYGRKPSWEPYTVLAWTAQFVNCILRENTCFTCYIIPNIWV